jgi:hypothetical protein
MKKHMRGVIQTTSRSKRFNAGPLGLSCLALALASVFARPALAADFTAGSSADLVTDIGLANASSDASSTITLTQSFQLGAGLLPPPTTALTINMQGFTLTGNSNISWTNTAATFQL